MPSQRAPFRLLRTAGVAASILSLAAGAHLLGGSRLPPPPVLAACSALVILGVVILTRWKLKTPVLAAVLASGQVLLHFLFSALTPRAGSALPPPLQGVHQHFGPGSAGGTGLPGGPETHIHLAWDLSPGMLMAHLAATLACAVLLAKGEAALWALAAWLRPILNLSPVTFVHATPTRALTRRQAPVPRRPVPRAHPRRGPPATA